MFLKGMPDKILVGLKIERDRTFTSFALFPCRKCKICLRRRSKKWAAKAYTETQASVRTWFGTMTFSPENRFIVKVQAQTRAHEAGVVWSELDQAERFRFLHDSAKREVTLFLKRIRENSQAVIRYLVVVEPHKDGFPHYHILVHECGGVILHRQLSSAWKQGFTNFKVVGSDNAPWYICKYIAKTALCRIRASRRYGPVASRTLSERVIGASKPISKGVGIG